MDTGQTRDVTNGEEERVCFSSPLSVPVVPAVRWLVGKGADMLATDVKGRLPRQTADVHGHAQTSALLSSLARNEWLRL